MRHLCTASCDFVLLENRMTSPLTLLQWGLFTNLLETPKRPTNSFVVVVCLSV